VLDLGGVIVDHDNALCLDRLIGLLEKPPTRDELASVVAASGIGNGSIDAAALFELIRQRYGSNSPLEEFLAAWTCHFSLRASTTGVGIAFDLSSRWLKHAYDAGLVLMAFSIASA
jgi:hypothetical protein